MPLPTITEAPAAFTPQAIVINAIAQALNSSRGQSGIKVTVSATQIIFDLAPTLNVSITGTAAFANTATYANTAADATHAADADYAAYADFAGVASIANVTSYANTAGAVDAANLTGTTLSANVTTSALTQVGTLSNITVAGPSNLANVDCTQLSADFGASSILISSAGFEINTGTKTATLAFASLTENMSIREIDVCSGNVAMKMLVLASAPY